MSLVIKKIVPSLSAIVGNKVVMAFGQIHILNRYFGKRKAKKKSCCSTVTIVRHYSDFQFTTSEATYMSDLSTVLLKEMHLNKQCMRKERN